MTVHGSVGLLLHTVQWLNYPDIFSTRKMAEAVTMPTWKYYVKVGVFCFWVWLLNPYITCKS